MTKGTVFYTDNWQELKCRVGCLVGFRKKGLTISFCTPLSQTPADPMSNLRLTPTKNRVGLSVRSEDLQDETFMSLKFRKENGKLFPEESEHNVQQNNATCL